MEPAAEINENKNILNSCGWSRFHHRLGGFANILLLQPHKEQTHTSCSRTWFIHTPGVCVCARARSTRLQDDCCEGHCCRGPGAAVLVRGRLPAAPPRGL